MAGRTSSDVARPGWGVGSQQWQALVAVAVTALAAALRWYHIAFQSLWLDEAASVSFASGGVLFILQSTFYKEPNPPLYYILLHFWMNIFGSSELAVRSLSALAGTAAVPLLYAVGRRLFTPTAGLCAAFALAINPFHVWLSQEARGFALLVLCGLAALYALIRAVESDRRAWWIAYAAAAFAMLYQHLYGLLWLGALVAIALLLGRSPGTLARGATRPPAVVARRNLPWRLAVASAVPLALYVPWLLTLVNQFGEPQWRTQVGGLEMLKGTLKTLSVGEEATQEYGGSWWLLWAALGGLAFLLPLRFRKHLASVGAVAVWLAVPLLAIYAVSAISPIYAPRYLIILAPALCLAVGFTLAMLGRALWPVALALAALLAWSATPVLNATYSLTIKEDFRGAAAYLREMASPEDAIVIMAGYTEYAFIYYGIDGETPLGDVNAPEQVEVALAPLAERHDRIWFAQSHYKFVDPNGYAEEWLDRHCRPVGERPFTGILITEYACGSGR